MTLNIYTWIIIATVLVEYIVSVAANMLNLRRLGDALPSEFADVYDAEAYVRSQQYTRERARFRLLSETFDLLVLFAFWIFGGFEWLDEIVRGWSLGPIWTGLLFIGILVLGRMVLSLPFSLYSTFGIEARFGFNRTTPATFTLDILKGLAIGVVLGGPLLAGVLWFFEYAGPGAWLYCWVAAAAFVLVMQVIIPTWIMPLFNKFKPLEDGQLRRDLLEYARSVQFPLSNIYVMDGSRRSSRSNAFFTGIGRNRRVALFDTLIERHSAPELLTVVAHEIGHYKKHHIIQGTIVSVLHLGALFLLLSFFISQPGLFAAFGMSHVSVYAGLIFFALLFSPIDLMLSIAMHVLSRRNEFEADNFAATTTGRPEAMIEALKRLSADNLSDLTPHPFYVFLFYSHPPVLERVRALQRIPRTAG